MKFPKSVHAEGWDQQVYGGSGQVKTNNPALNLKRGFKAGAKPVSLHTPLHGAVPAAVSTVRPAVSAPAVRPFASHAAAAPALASAAAAPRPAAGAPVGAAAPRSSNMPWVVGAGVGVLLIGGVVVMSQNVSLSGPAPESSATPVVVGQVTPSAEDAQLQSSPPSAGDATTPVAEVAAPEPQAAVDSQPAAPQAPARTAQAPAPSQPQVWAAKPADKADAPSPVIRTLTPPPEALAQASLPAPVREAPTTVMPPAAAPLSAAPIALTAPPADAASGVPVPALPQAAPPSTPPVATAPVAPPVMAQQAPAPAPAAPDPMDASITVQVRQALAADATLATVPIAVTTDHGVVKLEGQAPDVQARERATVVASNTTGVKAVDNRLTLPPVAASEQGALRVVAQAASGR